jgi:aldose 1-epimerase
MEPVRIAIESHGYRLGLAPASGGAITHLAWRHPERGWIDLLRPALESHPSPGDSAAFPMLPFANRIRDGRFQFGGRLVELPSGGFSRHAIHGLGLQRPWTVVAKSATSVSIALSYDAAEWPWSFVAEQTFALAEDGVRLRMSLSNRSGESMPFGLGLHPYLPRTPACTLTAQVGGFWETDADVLPTRLCSVPDHIDPRRGMLIDSIVCDNAFVGWDGRAIVTWPEHATRLEVTADSALGVLFLYVPQGQNFFCLEPATNLTDAFNLAASGTADTGFRVLGPGQSFGAEMTFGAAAI